MLCRLLLVLWLLLLLVLVVSVLLLPLLLVKDERDEETEDTMEDAQVVEASTNVVESVEKWSILYGMDGWNNSMWVDGLGWIVY